MGIVTHEVSVTAVFCAVAVADRGYICSPFLILFVVNHLCSSCMHSPSPICMTTTKQTMSMSI
jgi:hypothetical protein